MTTAAAAAHHSPSDTSKTSSMILYQNRLKTTPVLSSPGFKQTMTFFGKT